MPHRLPTSILGLKCLSMTKINQSKSYEYWFRIYAESTDFMGIVYHSNYLCFFERARTEMLREAGWPLDCLAREHECYFVIYDVHLQYRAAAKLDDWLLITSSVVEYTACGMVFEQQLLNENKRLLCKGQIKVACVNQTMKPKKLPSFLKNTS